MTTPWSVFAWLVMVAGVSLAYGGGRLVPLRLLAGFLMGSPGSSPEESTWAEIIIFLIGRIGSLLIVLLSFRAVWYDLWFEFGLSCAVLAGGLTVLALASPREKILDGLTDIRILRRFPPGYLIFSGRVCQDGPLCRSTLADLNLRRQGLLVLAIGRGDGYVHFPKGPEVLQGGDLVLLYGCLAPSPPRCKA